MFLISKNQNKLNLASIKKIYRNILQHIFQSSFHKFFSWKSQEIRLLNSRYFFNNKFYYIFIRLYQLYVRDFVRVKMDTEMMYEKLKQIFPHHIQNINYNQISLDTLRDLSSMNRNGRWKTDEFFLKNLTNLPQLPLQQIHTLCRNQEKNVMQKVMEIKQMDLYDEMADICPNHDLKIMKTYSQQEVNQKIHHYQSKIVIMAQVQAQRQRQYHQKNRQQESTDQSDDNIMDIQIELDQLSNNDDLQEQGGLHNLHDIHNIRHINQCRDGYLDINMMNGQDNRGGLRNILEEYDRHDKNLLWSGFDHIYDLH